MVFAFTVGMQQARHDFFAGPALAGEQHGGVRRSHFFDQPRYLLHGRAASYQALKLRVLIDLPSQQL